MRRWLIWSVYLFFGGIAFLAISNWYEGTVPEVKNFAAAALFWLVGAPLVVARFLAKPKSQRDHEEKMHLKDTFK